MLLRMPEPGPPGSHSGTVLSLFIKEFRKEILSGFLFEGLAINWRNQQWGNKTLWYIIHLIRILFVCLFVFNLGIWISNQSEKMHQIYVKTYKIRKLEETSFPISFPSCNFTMKKQSIQRKCDLTKNTGLVISEAGRKDGSLDFWWIKSLISRHLKSDIDNTLTGKLHT